MNSYLSFIVDLHKSNLTMYAVVSVVTMASVGFILSTISNIVLAILGIKIEKREKEEL